MHGFGVPDARSCALWEVQEGRCFHCGEDMILLGGPGTIKDYLATREHIYPRGGKAGKGLQNNIVLAHHGCNHKRGMAEPTEDEITRTQEIYAKMGLTAFVKAVTMEEDNFRYDVFTAAKLRLTGEYPKIPKSLGRYITPPPSPKLGEIIPKYYEGDAGREQFVNDWKTKWEPATEWLKEKK